MKDMSKDIKLTRIKYFWNFTKILLKVVAIWPITKNNLAYKKYIDSVHFFSVSFSALLQFILMGIMCLKLTDFNSAAESIGPMVRHFFHFKILSKIQLLHLDNITLDINVNIFFFRCN